jgi:hypothetical protein
MSRATKAQGLAHRVRRLQHPKDFGPHGYIGVSVGVANEVHAVLSTTKENVDAVRCLEKPNPFFLVAPDE